MPSEKQPESSGRAAAGEDPRKRRQIIDGAARLFFAAGFDAASMNDIAKAAGVSKGTLYVYFASKEALFAELVRESAAKLPAHHFVLDASDHDVAAVLGRAGRALISIITQPYFVDAMRAIIAMGDRMPEMGTIYYSGIHASLRGVADYLQRQVEAGYLKPLDRDPILLANYFMDMAQTSISRPMLFGAQGAPTPERVEEVVDGAVAIFMAAYGKER